MTEGIADSVADAMERCKDLLRCNLVDLDNMSVDCVADLLILARDRQRFTDRTPLTPELLLECGGELAGIPVGEFIRFRKWKVYPSGEVGEAAQHWTWMLGLTQVPWVLIPRTLGELEMFCELIRGRDNL